MRIEDQCPDVLQNIEFSVATFYRKHPEMSDYDVMRTYEALLGAYSAERIGREPKHGNPSTLESELFHAIRGMCEWRLGRNPLSAHDSGNPVEPPAKIEMDTLIMCLKRLLKSSRKWNKRGGRQGYLEFMSQFIK